MFPDVPAEVRPALQPHLKNVLGHVTKLEQQYAPFKPLMERGFNAQQVQGLIRFADDFDRDPKSMWLQLGQRLQQEGVLHEDLDVELLTLIANGEEIPDEDVGTPVGVQDPGLGEIPPWAQPILSFAQEYQTDKQTRQQTEQQQQEDQALTTAIETTKAKLIEAGFPKEAFADDGYLSETTLIGQIIANGGDPDAAVTALGKVRDGTLKGFTEQGGRRPLTPGDPPPAPKPQRKPRDGFEAARSGATSFLARENQASAQG